MEEKDYTLIFCRRRHNVADNTANDGKEVVVTEISDQSFSSNRSQILLGLKKRGFGVGKWNGLIVYRH